MFFYTISLFVEKINFYLFPILFFMLHFYRRKKCVRELLNYETCILV